MRDLLAKLDADARVLFLSGTPHQGHQARFKNLLQLLRRIGESANDLAGRVIYRTGERYSRLGGSPPYFRNEQLKSAHPVRCGAAIPTAGCAQFTSSIAHTVCSTSATTGKRAAGWRCAQALQWAASSPPAGLGYLVRQAIRAGWALQTRNLSAALTALRPYRGGAVDEAVDALPEPNTERYRIAERKRRSRGYGGSR